ncbi:hypothetical protein [Sphingobium yanoikuyae]|uniref:hypothetical protein n=1 Tax=Sphingobium yanoikuyae TaxID=13690 RepID=UPI0035C6F0C2
MSEHEYRTAVDAASHAASLHADWNVGFLIALDALGLRLVDLGDRELGRERHYISPPMPYPHGPLAKAWEAFACHIEDKE